MASKIIDKILEGAADLFARQGYPGCSTREIANRSDVTEPSIYRLFLSKERLFEGCLAMAIEELLPPKQFEALLCGEGEEERADIPATISLSVRKWYGSVSLRNARLMMHAALSDRKPWIKMAYEPLEEIIVILAKQLEKNVRVPRATAAVAARTLILALFQFKISRAQLAPSDGEREAVDKMIEQWLQGIGGR